MNSIEFELFQQYLSEMEKTIKKATKEDHMIHSFMIYRCKSCGSLYIMNLEKGLEDPTEDAKSGNHKPVPFMIKCILCGGDATHVLFETGRDGLGKNYHSYRDMTNKTGVKIYRNFFWNDPESDCGVPVLFEPDFYHSSFYDGVDPFKSVRHVPIVPISMLKKLKEDN